MGPLMRFSRLGTASGDFVPHRVALAAMSLKDVGEFHVVRLIICYKYCLHILNVSVI